MWDYLIVTASNAGQARAYESQMAARTAAGALACVRQALVVADLEDRRIGSGGSTLECLRVVANREGGRLEGLRVLIVHAGGDSRRLPAYGPCGKIFVPVPGDREGPLPWTLFDRLTPAFLDLPAPESGRGQIVVTAGDALLLFDARGLRWPTAGVTMLGSPATLDEAARHGVFCPGTGGMVRVYLQKPPRAEMEAMGAVGADGRAILDIGVTNLDAGAAMALLEAFGVVRGARGELEWSPAARESVLDRGIDLYREICCAMGAEATLAHYLRAARNAGSKWGDQALAALFPRLRAIPFHLRTLPAARFLHFGSTRQLAASGAALAGSPPSECLVLNSVGSAAGRESWVEGCRVAAPLSLAGRNVVIGVDVTEPLALPEGAALDLTPGHGATYVRCYGVGDSFKDSTYCGRPLEAWLETAGASPADVWDRDDRTLWSARMFPAEADAARFRRWLWMYAPWSATAEEKRAWRQGPRYSAEQIVGLADQEAFHRRRVEIRKEARC